MRHYTTAGVSFEAGHQLPDHSTECRWRHGHAWTVRVTVEGPLNPKTLQVVDHAELAVALSSIAREIDLRDLNEMLPGVRTTPEGISLYFYERLVLAWPRIVAIEVGMGRVTTRTEWELR